MPPALLVFVWLLTLAPNSVKLVTMNTTVSRKPMSVATADFCLQLLVLFAVKPPTNKCHLH